MTSGPSAEALRNVMAIGAREGFEFTAGELQEATSELTDEQLGAVTGGAGSDSRPLCYLKYKLGGASAKSWSTSGDG